MHEVTVIIPTYNRLNLLKDQLEALENQTADRALYDIIVVNDGSNDGTSAFLSTWSEAKSGRRTIDIANSGPAKARNMALSIAEGDIIAFTDDDCIVDNNWIEVIIDQFEDGLVGLQGATYTDRSKITPLTHQIDNETGHDSTPTCNAAYKRISLLQIGGFDEFFPNPHNEDTDVSWRMKEIGHIHFCSTMRVFHPPRKDSFSKVAKRMKIMNCEFKLFEKNPTQYRKYRDSSPFKHIYVEIFIKTIGYYFLSRIKLWKKPTQMIQGVSLAMIWWYDLITKLPEFYRKNKIVMRDVS